MKKVSLAGLLFIALLVACEHDSLIPGGTPPPGIRLQLWGPQQSALKQTFCPSSSVIVQRAAVMILQQKQKGWDMIPMQKSWKQSHRMNPQKVKHGKRLWKINLINGCPRFRLRHWINQKRILFTNGLCRELWTPQIAIPVATRHLSHTQVLYFPFFNQAVSVVTAVLRHRAMLILQLMKMCGRWHWAESCWVLFHMQPGLSRCRTVEINCPIAESPK